MRLPAAAFLIALTVTVVPAARAQDASSGDVSSGQGVSPESGISDGSDASDRSDLSDIPPKSVAAPAESSAGDIEEDTAITQSEHIANKDFSETEDAADSPETGPCWFRHVGIGFRAGASFREKATGNEFPADYALGPELYLAVWTYSIHRALIGAGYVYLNEEREKGSKQIRVHSEYHRIDVFAGYGIAWKLLTAGLRVGAAFTLVSIETAHGVPTWEIIGVGDEADLIIHDPTDVEVRERSGTSAGFLGGLSVGLAIGHYLFGIDDLIELRAQADYIRRDERDEFAVFGSLVFWPTRLIR